MLPATRVDPALSAAAATPLRVRVRSRRAGVRRRLHLTGQARFFAVVIHGCGRVAPPVRIGARELAAELVRGRGPCQPSWLREAFSCRLLFGTPKATQELMREATLVSRTLRSLLGGQMPKPPLL